MCMRASHACIGAPVWSSGFVHARTEFRDMGAFLPCVNNAGAQILVSFLTTLN